MAKNRRHKSGYHFFYAARLIHLYVSSALFALLVFFCATGYFLNHLEHFGGQHRDGDLLTPLTVSETERTNAYQFDNNKLLLRVQQQLAGNFNLNHAESVEFDESAQELVLNYSLPGGYATAVVLVQDEQLLLEFREGNWLTVINDLHKGRHSGAAWSWVIDLSAVLMVIFSLTGLIILWQNRRQRRMAFCITFLGALSPLVIYWLCVPHLIGV